MKVRAFTLIELLAVIAILAMLAVLIIPAFGGLRGQAETAACASNLRQIGAALLSFAADSDGFFPEAGGIIPLGGVNPGTGKASWMEQLEPYLSKADKVFRCPASSRVIAANRDFSYFLGARAAFLEMRDEGGSSPALQQMKIKDPSKYILGGDNVGDTFTVEDADKDDFVWNPAFAKPSPIHGGTVNVLFADGRVQAFKKFDSSLLEVTYDGSETAY